MTIHVAVRWVLDGYQILVYTLYWVCILMVIFTEAVYSLFSKYVEIQFH